VIRHLNVRALRHPVWTTERELMDEPILDPDVLAGNLRDLAFSNRWLGGDLLTLRALARLVAGLPATSRLHVLDIATGGADMPDAVLSWSHRRGYRARVVATDLSSQMLSIARRRVGTTTGMKFAAADARRLPFADASFDIATCSLALHHLLPADAVSMLREMRRVARLGIIVNDLVRCWHGYAGGWLFGHLVSRNRLTRHDAPLSFRRAYTVNEMLDLAHAAGLERLEVTDFLGFRVAISCSVGAASRQLHEPPGPETQKRQMMRAG